MSQYMDGALTPVELRELIINFGALEEAFENNASHIHSYLNVESGEVVRVIDGVTTPLLHDKITRDASYVHIPPVSSREQYSWMELFIEQVDDLVLQNKLRDSIDGKGAFRRFKDLLNVSSTLRQSWYVFRSEQVHIIINAWLSEHHILGIPEVVADVSNSGDKEVSTRRHTARKTTRIEDTMPADMVTPSHLVGEVRKEVQSHIHKGIRKSGTVTNRGSRLVLKELTALLPEHEVEAAVSFMEYLCVKNSIVPNISNDAINETQAIEDSLEDVVLDNVNTSKISYG